MRIVFLGSAEFAVPCVEALLGSGPDRLVGVVAQPDRPAGRSLRSRPCPVKALLAGRAVPVLTPERVNDEESVRAIAGLGPDVIVVVAYGQILRRPLLDLAPHGCLNVHASLLPKYRGAAPIQWAIARGEPVTGVTVMHVNERMDEGDIVAQRSEPILEDDTAGTLHNRLAKIGAALLIETLDLVRAGTAPRIPQDHSLATYAPKLSKADGPIVWTMPAAELRNRVRAFNPWPGCNCEWPGPHPRLLKVLAARVEPGRPGAAAGTVLDQAGGGPLVQTGLDALRLLEVQPENGWRMTGAAFACGHPLPPGTVLK